MPQDNVIIRFNQVSFSYGDKKTILEEADFSVRRNSIITIMGQNGAGKSTIFKLLLGKLKPQRGSISIENGTRIGIAEQMVPHSAHNLDLLSYFKTASKHSDNSLKNEIAVVFKAVGLNISLDKKVKDLSGGQKARLLLAYALITNPDILLLDEPTNNLDAEGIGQLTVFLMNYKKTCIVISHDADFLNCFTDGVLNLDSHTHKVEQFVGNYYDVQEEIAAKLERDQLLNSRLERSIKDRFTKVNKLGGKSIAMSRLATRIRKDIEEDRGEKAVMRVEDKTIPEFSIPNQDYVGFILKIKQPLEMEMVKGSRILVKGPNGIGKSTLLKSMLTGKAAERNPAIRIGYYSQDFSELNFNQTAFDSLYEVSQNKQAEAIYGAAGRFLLSGDMLKNHVGSLSEGQKGLLCYARFMLQIPGILILDEPTNHINFRHIPVIAKAINSYQGPVILVSHLPDFVSQIKNVRPLDLEASHSRFALDFA